MEKKITAVKDGNRIKVHADFFVGKKKVHEVNFAFPLETGAKEIEESVEKAGKLFELEKEQAIEQAKVDKSNAQAQQTINKLNS